jgi:hypothetical protein
MKKKHTTKTGALSKSAGFPGKDMINFEVKMKPFMVSTSTPDVNYKPYKLIGVEKNNEITHRNYWYIGPDELSPTKNRLKFVVTQSFYDKALPILGENLGWDKNKVRVIISPSFTD